MKVVFDTNIFIAAALKGGFAEEIIKMASTGLVELICSEEILKELRDKLVKKFEWSREDALFFIRNIREVCEVVEPEERISRIVRDPQDNKILECAVAGKADLIVSSDQDLIKLKTFRKIAIIHPKTLSWIFPEHFKKAID